LQNPKAKLQDKSFRKLALICQKKFVKKIYSILLNGKIPFDVTWAKKKAPQTKQHHSIDSMKAVDSQQYVLSLERYFVRLITKLNHDSTKIKLTWHLINIGNFYLTCCSNRKVSKQYDLARKTEHTLK